MTKFHADPEALEAATALIQTHTKTSKRRAKITAEAMFEALGIQIAEPPKSEPTFTLRHAAVIVPVFFILGIIVTQIIKQNGA